jgi:tRNA-specific 2-thiouridylase
MQPVPARIEINGDSGKITLPSAYRAITPGQACVMYDGERMIGGGWITRD